MKDSLDILRTDYSSEDFIEHHGIKGMKWGVRNGPPYPLNHKGQFKAVKTLNDEMNKNWDYGVLHNGKKITDLKDFNYEKDYRTIPIEQMRKEKIGLCWDMVNYQHAVFKEKGYPDKSYMFVSPYDNGIVTHTFSVVSIGDKNYWVESAKWNDRGVHEVKDYKDVINHLRKQDYGSPEYDVYEFNPDGLDKGLTDKEYFDKATENLIYTSTKKR